MTTPFKKIVTCPPNPLLSGTKFDRPRTIDAGLVKGLAPHIVRTNSPLESNILTISAWQFGVGEKVFVAEPVGVVVRVLVGVTVGVKVKVIVRV
jgi:hypothetical protein